MEEIEPQTAETQALWNLRAVLPEEYKRVVKTYAAKHGISVPDAVAMAIRILAASEGAPMGDHTYSASSYARAS